MKSIKRYTNIKYHLSHTSKILFIGPNPSPGSYQRSVPFSSNKSFWYLLHDAGLIPESRHELQNDKTLKNIYTTKFTPLYHLSLLNLVRRPTKTVAEIKREEVVPGILTIMSALKRYHTPVVCFIGKITYQLFAQISHCEYGWQAPIGSSQVFVMHSPLRGFAHIRIKELKEVAKASGL